MTAGLVIGGGGVGGIAWTLGLLVGLDRLGLLPASWSSIVGTSAGATVGAQLSTGRLLDSFDAQFRPSNELMVEVDLAEYRRQIVEIIGTERNGRVARQRIGQMALASATVDPEARRSVIDERLGSADWPEDDALRITAVDVDTGELVVLGRDDGVPLVDAVTASCAVPAVWPVVVADGRRLMDGGIRSSTNADLGEGEVLVVVVPSALDDRGRSRLERELTSRHAVVVELDAAASAAIGSNPFDPACRAAAATAGLALAERVAHRVDAALAPTR